MPLAKRPVVAKLNLRGAEMGGGTLAELQAMIAKRRRFVGIAFLLLLIILIVVVARGYQYLSASHFLLRQGELGPGELLRTIRLWFWANVVLVSSYVTVLAIWYMTDRQILKILKLGLGKKEPS